MSKLEFKAEASDIRTKIEALLKRNGEIFLAHHNGDNYYSEKYTQKLESIVRASVGLVEALKHNRDIHSVSVCFRGEHVKQLDGSVKYEMLPTMHHRAKEIADEALAQFAAEVERVGKS